MVIIETRELNLFDSPVSNLHTQTFNIPTRETITDCVLYKANTIIKEEQLSRGKNTDLISFSLHLIVLLCRPVLPTDGQIISSVIRIEERN